MLAFQQLYYRPLQPEDFEAVKQAHAVLFPIDYEDGFFHKASNGLDRIWSCAAFSIDSFGQEQLAGFITAKIVHLHECDTSDRQHMGLLSPVVDHDFVLYILTLGVLEDFRQQGVASHLISCVCQHAYETHCQAVFLHVISYNTAAMSLYMRAGFHCVARLSNFYHIATGRQPDPAIVVHDAFLYVLFTGPPQADLGSTWDLLTIAWSPVRTALGRIHSCMPQLCRQYPGSSTVTCGGTVCTTTAGAAAAHRSSSCNSVNSYQQPLDMCPQQQQLELVRPQEQLVRPREQQQQHIQIQMPPYSRYRHRQRPQSPCAGDKQQQQQQQERQQYAVLLPPVVQQHSCLQQYQQQWQHQHQHLQQERHVQQRQHLQQHQRRSSPQRVLQWLFNGSSRSPSAVSAPHPPVPPSLSGWQQQEQQNQQQLQQQQLSQNGHHHHHHDHHHHHQQQQQGQEEDP